MRSLRSLRNIALTLVGLGLAAGSARADLYEYVKRTDPSYSWKLKEKVENAQGTIYELRLTSQTWQGIVWEHQLQVFLPKNVKPTATMFLWNQGGNSSPTSVMFGMDLAAKMKAPVAFLYNVPNQPLFEGKREDALIAETFIRYLDTKDASWPLLFPMVKSMVKAMDALQEFAMREWSVQVTHFVVSGGSKRGWTSWLTAAADPRVKALAPLVIDTLNMKAQLPHQLKSYGRPSDMIRDYTQRGLVHFPPKPEHEHLWSMVDPWTHRDKIKQPKMIINGTNDPYWTQDALNIYWDDLKGDKWVLYVPNAGHNLQQKNALGIPDMTRARNTLAAFAASQIHDRPMPKIRWNHSQTSNPKLKLTAESDTVPKSVRLWTTTGATRDFRQCTWKEQAVKVNGKTINVELDAPMEGYVVYFAEFEFDNAGFPYFLSTQLRIAGKDKN